MLSGTIMTGLSSPICLCMYLIWWHLKSKRACRWFNSAPEHEACVHRDVSEVFGGKRIRGAEVGHRRTRLCRLCYILRLLGGPELFVLFASEALVVVAFAFEQLLKVRFTVKFTLKSRKGAKAAERRDIIQHDKYTTRDRSKRKEDLNDMQSPQFGIAVLAAEARWVEDQIVCNQSLHWVDRLLTWCAHFLLCLKAEGLNTDMQWFPTTERQ